MKTLRDYQQIFLQDAAERLDDGERVMLYSSPTGSGKSVMELALRDVLTQRGYDTWILTPRVEIVSGMLGVGLKQAGSAGLENKITTPAMLLNRLRDGRITIGQRSALIFDEAHHSTASTWAEVRAAAPTAVLFGLTASPYRGTPQGTQELRAFWGEPIIILTIPDAVQRNVVAAPAFRVVPLIDDDEIDVANGEFVVKRLESATKSRLDHVVELIAANSGDKPTLVSLPSTTLVSTTAQLLALRGVPHVCVTQATTPDGRAEAFRRCVEGNAVLLQINVVSEGVDIPQLRRLIDCSPTMSPVRWVQQVGRITRPGPVSAEYICTNRNVERHGHLWFGALPFDDVRKCVTAFAKPSTRASLTRGVGLEKIGRFRPVDLPLKGGMFAALYAFQVVETSGLVREFVAIVNPMSSDPLYAARVRGNAESGYGTWQQIESLPDITGATPKSFPSKPLTPKQEEWWKRSAGRYGLDGGAEVNSKQFQALPILRDIGLEVMT